MFFLPPFFTGNIISRVYVIRFRRPRMRTDATPPTSDGPSKSFHTLVTTFARALLLRVFHDDGRRRYVFRDVARTSEPQRRPRVYIFTVKLDWYLYVVGPTIIVGGNGWRQLRNNTISICRQIFTETLRQIEITDTRMK